MRRKKPAADQRNTQQLHAVRRNKTYIRSGMRIALIHGPAFDNESRIHWHGRREWSSIIDSHSQNSRLALQLTDDAIKKIARRGIVILAEVEWDIGCENVFRVVTGIDLLQLYKAADHQPGSNQQHKAQGHLSGDQHIAQPQAAGLYRGIGAALFQ